MRKTLGCGQAFGDGFLAPIGGVHANQTTCQLGDVQGAVFANDHLSGALQAGDHLFFVMQIFTAELRNRSSGQLQHQHAAIWHLDRIHGCAQAMCNGFGALVFAAHHLHSASEPAGKNVVVFGQTHSKWVFQYIALHTTDISQSTGGGVHRTEAKQVGHEQGFAVFRQLDAPRCGHAAFGNLRDFARFGVDLLHAVVDHIADKNVVVFVQRQIVHAGGELRHLGAFAVSRVDAIEFTEFGINRPNIPLAIVVGRSRCFEFAVDDFHLAIGGVDLDDLSLEPQWPHDPTIGANLKTVQASHVFFDETRRGNTRHIDLPQGVAQEHLAGVELAAFLVEGQRVDAGQVFGQDADGGAVVVADAHDALQERGVGHFAFGTNGDVVGLPLGRGDQGRAFAGLDIDLGNGCAHHAAHQ